MMKIKTLCTVGAIAASLAAAAKTSTPKGWIDDYDLALKRAAEEGKVIVADFSGSDWCGWCKKLDKEIFATKDFRNGAKEKYILLMIDSPNDKSLLSEKAARQNRKLVKKYGVSGFPTVLLLDAKGEVLGKAGYEKTTPEKYLEKLDGLVAKGTDPDYLSKVKPVLNAVVDAQSSFDKRVSEMQKAALTQALVANLPALRAALDEARAAEVPEKYAGEKSDAVTSLEKMIAKVEGFIEEVSKEGEGEEEDEGDE